MKMIAAAAIMTAVAVVTAAAARVTAVAVVQQRGRLLGTTSGRVNGSQEDRHGENQESSVLYIPSIYKFHVTLHFQIFPTFFCKMLSFTRNTLTATPWSLAIARLFANDLSLSSIIA